MCFAFADAPSPSSCFNATWLSTRSGIGPRNVTPSSSKSSRTPSSSVAMTEAAVYSASMVDNETPPCFRQAQLTGIPSIVICPPVVDFLSILSAAQSASLYATTSSDSPWPLPPHIRSRSSFVPIKYLVILFANFQFAVVGLCVLRDALWTANAMSGRVHLAIHIRLPSSD
eukprot:jgi/Phyca11/120257/e_gw1.41.258.1